MKLDGKISLRFGLWFSQICVKNEDDDDDSVDDDVADDDDDMQRRHKKHHRKCHCEKISSDCFFETYDMFGLLTYDQTGKNSHHEDRKGRLPWLL